MFVFKYKENIFCYLVNPKCGTHTFTNFYRSVLSQLDFFIELHVSSEQPVDCNNLIEYSNYNYYHCNLEGAINFFKIKNINLENVTFFTTIRNPFERMLSNYWYRLKYNKCDKMDSSLTQQEDFNNCVLNGYHHKFFEPKKFRFSEDYPVHVHVLRLENWSEDFKLFCEKHNLCCEKTHLLKDVVLNTSSRKQILNFNQEVTKYIVDNYLLDFKEGEYNLQPPNY
jgi:hypothetical protein